MLGLKASEHVCRIIIVGNINKDQLNFYNHTFCDIMSLNNMSNYINEPTRITNNTRTLLDPIATKNNIIVCDSGKHETPPEIRDHFDIYIITKTDFTAPLPYKRHVWRYKGADFSKLNNLIQNTDWSFINENYVDEACNLFTSTFLNLGKQCIPTDFITIRPNDKPSYHGIILI